VSGLRSEQREGSRSRGRGKARRHGRKAGQWADIVTCTLLSVHVHAHVLVTHFYTLLFQYLLYILTAPPQLVDKTTADRDPAIDKGPLWRGEESDPLVGISARALCDCCCRRCCPQRVHCDLQESRSYSIYFYPQQKKNNDSET
jgi:hypothetical protein